MGLNINQISKSYNKIVNLAETSYRKGNLEAALSYIEAAANVAYNFNVIYTDEKLEYLLKEISFEMLGTKEVNFETSGRIVFYDFFGMVNRGLTQQYIRALMRMEVEFMYILENSGHNSQPILDELSTYPKGRIVLIDHLLPYTEKILNLFNIINDFRPSKALLHLHPASVVGVTLWNAFPKVQRYQINLTDHAFWLGVKCIDYCLEFRNYGCTVSTEKRNIHPDKLLMQPYYPITDCADFKGLPDFGDDKVIILTGGTFYKMYGDGDKFFIIMKKLLDQNPKAVIIIAGEGDEQPIIKFVADNNFADRIFLIGKRNDINYVFKKSDICLSTYPISGGLMSQFAGWNSKPILSYTDEDIPCNDVDGLFFFENGEVKRNITFHDLDVYLSYAKKLIDDQNFRSQEGKHLKKGVISEDKFTEILAYNLYHSSEQIKFKKIEIDYNRFADLYIEVANRFVFNYHTIIFKKFKLMSFFLFPKEAWSKNSFLLFFKIIKKKLRLER